MKRSTSKKTPQTSPFTGDLVVGSAKQQQHLSRLAARKAAVQAKLASLRIAAALLKQQVAESREDLSDLARKCLFPELEAVVMQKFRVRKVSGRQSSTCESQRWPCSSEADDRWSFFDIDGLLEAANAGPVDPSKLISAIRTLLEENKLLRELHAASSVKVMMTERKLRSSFDDLKIKTAVIQRNSDMFSSTDIARRSLEERIAHLDAQIENVQNEMVTIETNIEEQSQETRIVEQQIAIIEETKAAEEEKAARALRRKKSTRNSASPHEYWRSSDDDSFEIEDVVERIYKRHDDWLTKWDAVSDDHRQEVQEKLLRQASDRFQSAGDDAPNGLLSLSLVPQPSIQIMSPSVRHLSAPDFFAQDAPFQSDTKVPLSPGLFSLPAELGGSSSSLSNAFMLAQSPRQQSLSPKASVRRHNATSAEASPVSPGMSYQLPPRLGRGGSAVSSPSGGSVGLPAIPLVGQRSPRSGNPSPGQELCLVPRRPSAGLPSPGSARSLQSGNTLVQSDSLSGLDDEHDDGPSSRDSRDKKAHVKRRRDEKPGSALNTQEGRGGVAVKHQGGSVNDLYFVGANALAPASPGTWDVAASRDSRGFRLQ
jgi:hypothetical protein